MVNTLNWFEIPASHFERATTFYSQVLDVQIHIDPSPNMQYAYLPGDPQKACSAAPLPAGPTLLLP